MMTELLTVAETARLLKVNPVTVRRYIADGRLPAARYAVQVGSFADADNAAFAVELAGGGRAPIVFAEGVHGYSSARGLGAIPSHWKVALFGIAGAAVLFAWGRARRLGPPDRPHRPLPPARAEYVDALAAALEHTRDPAAALAELASITRDRADRESIVLDGADRVALATPPNDNSEVRALGRVAARVARRDSESRSEP